MSPRKIQQEQLSGLRLLVVESDLNVRHALSSSLRAQGAKVALAKTNAEAFELLQDAQFLEFEFDGLLVSERLTDGPGWWIVEGFHREHALQPVLLLSRDPDLTLQIWSRAHDVRLVTAVDVQEFRLVRSLAVA